MKEEKYTFKKIPEQFYYEFYSKGPKGRIKKLVPYRLIEEFPNRVYNLSFGDWSEAIGNADDRITTIMLTGKRYWQLWLIQSLILPMTVQMFSYLFKGVLHLEPGFIKWRFLLFGMK